MAQVGIVMGSDSDLSVMSKAAEVLDEFGISYEMHIISAHREPDIFFDWAKDGIDGSSDHVGIVEYYDIEKNIVHTVEGNSNDECKQREYSKDDNQIMGYGRPLF